MSGPHLKIVSDFVPYSDGSGFQVTVTIEQEYEGAEATIAIETAYRFDASRWPEIRAGIDRLLSAVTPSPIEKVQP